MDDANPLNQYNDYHSRLSTRIRRGFFHGLVFHSQESVKPMSAQSFSLKCYMKLLALFSLLFSSLSCLYADELGMEFNRNLYGNSSLPLWNQLTAFEETVLSQRALAGNGDPDALLGFYILAAGSHRDLASYQKYKTLLDQWLNNIGKDLRRKRKIADKGEALHQAMHRDFFLSDENNNLLIGYDADQSQLPEIFNSQRFNCISSALLYIVLARKLGLPVEGVLLPSHAFVQLNAENGRAIEIETTSVFGFDSEHSEAFYQNTDRQWFAERNLEPTTYQDYLAREIVSPYKLGLHNMWSQHTSLERMDYRDRFRLAEIRAYLQPDDVGAQKIRLNYYLQELAYLNRRQDHLSLARLVDTISPYLSQVQSSHWQDSDLRTLWIGVQTEIAFAKIKNGELEQGFLLAKRLLDNYISDSTQADQQQANLYVVISHFVSQRTAKKDFAQTRIALMGMEQDCVTDQSCSRSLGQLYAAWGQQFWDQQDWQTAGRIFTEYLQFNINNENTLAFQNNAELAFINEAREMLLDGDWEMALIRLQSCVDQLPLTERCTQQITNIKEQRHLGNL